MRLLLDTDAFCMFADVGLLEPAAQAIGVDIESCGRLPALPQMLRRGGLRAMLGEERADRLMPTAAGIRTVPAASPEWINRLTGVHDIDVGEAQLLALAAENDLLLLTGDKRAVSAVRAVEGFVTALRGKIVLPEVILFRLCEVQGDDKVRAAIAGGQFSEKMLRVAFSPENHSPRGALRSYVDAATRDLAPLALWPQPIGAQK